MLGQLNSCTWAVPPASITLAFPLSFPERLSQNGLLLVSRRGVGRVRLRSYLCPFQDEPRLSENRCSVELSSPSFSQFCRQPLEHADRRRSLPPNSRLIGFNVSRLASHLFPIVSRFFYVPGWRRSRRISLLPQRSPQPLVFCMLRHCSSSRPGSWRQHRSSPL